MERNYFLVFNIDEFDYPKFFKALYRFVYLEFGVSYSVGVRVVSSKEFKSNYDRVVYSKEFESNGDQRFFFY
jgi:hypothetical protein